MPGKLSDKKQRISSSQEKKLVEQVQKIAQAEGISLTEALRRALKKLVEDYESDKKRKTK